MDTIDRPDSNVPARYPADPSRVPSPMPSMSYDLAVPSSPSAPQITPRVLMRGLSRHWWRIAAGWLILSAPLAFLIYRVVEPTYEATSLLRAEPTAESIYSANLHGSASQSADRSYLKTQVQLIRSEGVLDMALAAAGISKLPMIASSKDPKATLRKELNAVIVGSDTYLIEVSLASEDAHEAAALVNAVVGAYMDKHKEYQNTANRSLKTKLEAEKVKLEKDSEDLKARLKDLVGKGTVGVGDEFVLSKDDDESTKTSFAKVGETQFANLNGELLKLDLELIDLEAQLATAKAQLATAQEMAAAQGEQRSRLAAQQLEMQIREAFQDDPDAQPLIEQIHRAREQLERTKRLARRSDDPGAQAAVREVQKLEKQWAELWERKHDEIKQLLVEGGEDQRPEALEDRVRGIEAMIGQHRTKRQTLKDMVAGLKIERTSQNNDQLDATLMSQDLQRVRNVLQVIDSKIKQVEFEIGQDTYRIEVVDRASPAKAPSNNKQLKYMAAAPAGVLFLMLGVFLLLEVKAERVADLDALSTRVQSEVYALPPLPTARSIRKRAAPDAGDQIEQFIQRLDHLRFAVCGNPAELEKGRCVLITSAIGGEGKTTLAAQLAARCGNAGMSTLLIDADLRRTGLCALLDIPEGPGLSDALLNDDPPPTELVVPVQGGTFHLLPAGTPIPDTSRVLQNRKLGLLIAQFRQLYDLVIIDSPPVLPVPDALILGRWVDGAVLAVRYDISRFPKVERARRQLDGAGISVLGTVINGMKNSDSYYGRYSYSRKRSPQADSPAAY